MQLDIYSGITNTIKGSITIYDTFIFNHTLMQEHRISVANYFLSAPLGVQLGDYILYKSNKYKINTTPTVQVTAFYTYGFVLEGPEYDLFRKIIMHEGAADFPYYADAEGHLQLLIDNINSIDSGWSLGVVEATNSIFISYVNLSCRTALNTIADAFGMEFSIENKEISLKLQAGSNTAYEFQVGQFKGMYSLTRTAINDKKIVTKVYGFGSTRNLPAGYRGGQTRLVFEDRFLTNNTGIYGIIEGQYTDEEIYPTREGDVTAVVAGFTDDSKTFTIEDSTLDFNLNDYILQSVEPKVSFTTGDLLGEEFVIKSYDNATKKITLIVKVNSSNIKLPSVSPEFLPLPGDKYKLLDIGLPATYVTAAEVKLQAGTLVYITENSIPRVEYDLQIDPLFAKIQNIELKPGDRIKIVNAALGINHMIRVNSVEYPITFPEELTKNTKYNLSIGNFVSYDLEERLAASVIQNRKNIVTVDRRSIELARRNTSNLRELQNLIFDPDDFFDPGNIRPFSIETYMLSVGAKSQNFRLNGVVFQPNYLGNANELSISGGVLEHFEIDIPGLGYSWVIPATSFSALDPTKAYYMFAKCSTSVLTGEWKLSLTPVDTEETPGYYNFNLGILYKVVSGYRDYDFTYGISTIVGDNITTGKVKDITGQNYFDLKTGKFNMGVLASGVDWDVTTANKFTLRGTLVQSGSGQTSLIATFRGAYNALTTYYDGDTVTNDGSLWRYINAVPAAGITPVEGANWTAEAEKGETGDTGDAVYIQYSAFDDTGWHDTFTDGDLYMRQKIGIGGTYSYAMRIVGEEGEPGVDGQYTSYEFAKNTSLTVAPTTGFTDAPPALDPGEFLWLRIGVFEGDGTQIGTWTDPVRISGPKGDTGEDANFTEFRFAENGSTTVPPALTNTDISPALWSTTQPTVAPGHYLWVIQVVKTPAGALVGTWSDPVRINGEPGLPGSAGSQGPYITNSGTYDNARTYVGSTDRVEAVFYSGTWYVTRTDAGSFSGTLPTNPAKWNVIGATFDSVATGLLLASAATIDNLTVRNVVTSDTGQKVGISGPDNNFFFHDSSGTEVLLLDDNIIPLEGGGFGPGIRLGQVLDNFLYIGEEGLFIYNTTTGKSAYMRTTGIKTSGNLDIGGDFDLAGTLRVKDGSGFVDGQTQTYSILLSSPPGAVVNLNFVNGILVP